MKYKPYTKVINIKDFYGVCAIYERNPFGDDLCWVYYDWCGNPVGLGGEIPNGDVVDKLTKENIGRQDLADYLNKEPVKFTT